MEGEREGLGPRFLAGAAATFLVLLAASEVGSRWALRSGLLYRRFDFSGTLTSLAELRDRIAWDREQPRPIFLLGDSVLGASAMVEHRIAGARRMTVPAALGDEARPRGWSVASLAADGLLVPDLDAIAAELDRAAAASGPGRVVVVLNFRMFASEFEAPGRAISRDFLLPALAGELPDPRMAVGANGLDERLSEASVRASYLLRTTRLLQPLWYYPSRRDVFRRWLESGETSEGAEVREAALRLKVAPFYRDRWNPAGLEFRALGQLLAKLQQRGTLIVLSPQNPEFVEDAGVFAANRATLRGFVEAKAAPGIAYADLSDRFPAGAFLDHCHLTPDANRQYARSLLERIAS